MQKQIIVPLATAIIAQTANALTLQDPVNPLSQISANPLELAQIHESTETEAECRERVAIKKAKRDRKCRKNNAGDQAGLDACLADLEEWEKRKLHKCLPCDQKVIKKHGIKHAKCEEKKNEKGRNRCRAKWDAWRDAKLEECEISEYTCEEKAKYERERARKECDLIQDPDEKNKCNANAD